MSTEQGQLQAKTAPRPPPSVLERIAANRSRNQEPLDWEPVPIAVNHPRLQPLHAALSNKALSCATGAFALPSPDLVLYYGEKGQNTSPERIDFGAHAEDDIKRLAEYCDPASFGRGGENVHDESYRKAGKLDKGDFAVTFDPVACGLIDRIRDNLLEGHGSNKTLRVEPYKLNVYGPGSFFKAHKDTPRAENMLGSLVVVYPTSHQGGTLIFRHGDQVADFDSASILSTVSTPSVAYAAFFGDVEHEVKLVESGYRVTLTYNIYLVDTQGLSVPASTTSACENVLTETFRTLLADQMYLPEGGIIGFDLRHEYPIKAYPHELTKAERSLLHLLDAMKGSDAVLVNVCKTLGLKVSIQMLYDEEDCLKLVSELVKYNPDEGYNPFNSLFRRGRAKFLTRDLKQDHKIEDATVHWATDMKPIDLKSGAICHPFVTYGNESHLAEIYSKLCLIVEVDPAASRLGSQS